MKIDLHNHSPSSFDYRGNKSTAVDETAKQLLAKDIDVVMFTDHDRLPEKYFTEEVAKRTGKLVLRGSELNVFVDAFDKPSGKVDKHLFFHLLVGFDPDNNPDFQIEHLKRAFTVETRDCGSEKISGLVGDLGSIIEHLLGTNAIVMPAHLHSGKDAFRTRSIDQIYDDPLFLKLVPKFTAMEVTNSRTAEYFDGNHAETGNLLKTCIQSSDSHDAINLGQRVSWAQMQLPTFAELKSALQFHSRVSLTKPLEPDSYIIGLHIKGSFYPDLWLSMSPHCNAFIGVKGSGKTSVLECLRFALGSAVPESRKADVDAQRSYILGPGGVVSVLLKRKDGATVLVQRSNAPPQEFILTFDDGRVVQMQNPEGLAFPSYILGWHEIENAATDPAIRRIYLNEITGKDKVAESERQLTEGVNRVSTLHKELFEQYSLMKSNENHARVLREKRDGLQKLSDAKLILLKNEYEAATIHLAAMQEFFTEITTDAASLKERLRSLSISFSTQLTSQSSPLMPMLQNTILALHPLEEQLEHFEAERKRLLDDLIKTVTQEVANTDNAYRQFGSEYQDKFNALPQEHQRLLGEHQRVLLETQQLPDFESKAATQRQRVRTLLAELIETCNGIADKLDQQSTARKHRIEDLNQRIGPRGVKLELVQNNTSRLYQEYTSRFPQGSQAYSEIISQYGADRQHRRLAKAYKSLLDNFEQGTPLFLAYAEFLNFVQPFEEDDLAIFFNVGKEGEQYSPINEMSAGQRCTAMFPLLLEIGSGPLIMDQPEDNLDNRHIAASTADAIVACKPFRQVAFTSHNANLVVLTDAEQIVAFESKGSTGTITDRGFFSHVNSSVRVHVMDILDGGQRALEMRNRKYSISD